MVKVKKFKWSYPNTGLLFIIAGLAVGNYSYEKYEQKYLNKGKAAQVQREFVFSDQFIQEIRREVEIINPTNDVHDSLNKFCKSDENFLPGANDNKLKMDSIVGSAEEQYLQTNTRPKFSGKANVVFNDEWENKHIAERPNHSQIRNMIKEDV